MAPRIVDRTPPRAATILRKVSQRGLRIEESMGEYRISSQSKTYEKMRIAEPLFILLMACEQFRITITDIKRGDLQNTDNR